MALIVFVFVLFFCVTFYFNQRHWHVKLVPFFAFFLGLGIQLPSFLLFYCLFFRVQNFNVITCVRWNFNFFFLLNYEQCLILEFIDERLPLNF